MSNNNDKNRLQPRANQVINQTLFGVENYKAKYGSSLHQNMQNVSGDTVRFMGALQQAIDLGLTDVEDIITTVANQTKSLTLKPHERGLRGEAHEIAIEQGHEVMRIQPIPGQEQTQQATGLGGLMRPKPQGES